MKYFKYRNISKVQQIVYKERLASLGKDEQKKIKRSDRLTKLLSIIGFVFFFCCIGMFIFFIKLIPVPKNILLKILYGIGVNADNKTATVPYFLYNSSTAFNFSALDLNK